MSNLMAMYVLRRTLFVLIAITVLAVAVGESLEIGVDEALCKGQRFGLTNVRGGVSPYVVLSAEGRSGQFLLDYGSTSSSLSAGAFASNSGSIRTENFSLPGFSGGSFLLTRYDLSRQPPGGQLGIVGTDFLSLMTAQFAVADTGGAVFLGVQACNADALHMHGLVPVRQGDFFSSSRSRFEYGLPNVPVVFLRIGEVHTWAQVDTGYDDVVYKHSVDINQALFERLIDAGIALDHIADINVRTCEGNETRSVYTVKDHSLVIETDEQAPIVRLEAFHLILKPVNRCGGIGTMPTPAAQLGATFVRIFGTVVFDPRSETVWLGHKAGERDARLPSGVP